MDGRGLKISSAKTVGLYLRSNENDNLYGNSYINIQRENLERATTFKYLGATMAENGYLDDNCRERRLG